MQTQQQNSDISTEWSGSEELQGRPGRNRAAAAVQKIEAAQRESHTISCCYEQSFLQPRCKANASPQGQRHCKNELMGKKHGRIKTPERDTSTAC